MKAPQDPARRKFVTDLSLTTAALIAAPTLSRAAGVFKPDSITVGEIIDKFIKNIPGAPFPKTVDTLKSGSRDMVVANIVTTMFATVDVIRQAIDFGANFIIAHEPTFYNHEDNVDWLQNDPVYQYKYNLIKQHNITIWRNHDYIHSLVPDGVTTGVVEKLGWKQYQRSANTFVMEPGVSLQNLIGHAKQKLGAPMVRYIGDLNQSCKNILLMPGAAGGVNQVTNIRNIKPDVLVCGEISEWETAEYVRDARAEGQNIALVLLGHIPSEEAGSEFMLQWLKENVPSIKAKHVSSGNSLSFA
jgi:putative NIF3 family GTP cyclohydrolase 1 type 2